MGSGGVYSDGEERGVVFRAVGDNSGAGSYVGALEVVDIYGARCAIGSGVGDLCETTAEGAPLFPVVKGAVGGE